MNLIEAHTDAHVDLVREIFSEYQRWLGFDLCFQHFDEELANLPGDYAPPSGRLYLAEEDGQIAGCIALREFSPGVCEMKRLYVRDSFRGRGLGRTLATTVIDDARRIGYKRMMLDTLPSMTTAIRMYESFGFVDVASYRENPIEGARFMELVL